MTRVPTCGTWNHEHFAATLKLMRKNRAVIHKKINAILNDKFAGPSLNAHYVNIDRAV